MGGRSSWEYNESSELVMILTPWATMNGKSDGVSIAISQYVTPVVVCHGLDLKHFGNECI